MYYIRKAPTNIGEHGPIMTEYFVGSVELPSEFISKYIAYKGFCNLTINNNIVTDMTINVIALNKYMTDHPDIKPEKTTTIEDLKNENKLLKAQLKAQTDRSDFIEDCIAEMAEVVYNTEETT